MAQVVDLVDIGFEMQAPQNQEYLRHCLCQLID